MNFSSKTLIWILLILAVMNILVIGVFKDFVEVNAPRYKETLNYIEECPDLQRVKSLATSNMSFLYAQDQAAYEFWKYSTIIASGNIITIVSLVVIMIRSKKAVVSKESIA